MFPQAGHWNVSTLFVVLVNFNQRDSGAPHLGQGGMAAGGLIESMGGIAFYSAPNSCQPSPGQARSSPPASTALGSSSVLPHRRRKLEWASARARLAEPFELFECAALLGGLIQADVALAGLFLQA